MFFARFKRAFRWMIHDRSRWSSAFLAIEGLVVAVISLTAGGIMCTGIPAVVPIGILLVAAFFFLFPLCGLVLLHSILGLPNSWIDRRD